MKEGFPLNLGVRGLSALICDYQHEQGKEFAYKNFQSECDYGVVQYWKPAGQESQNWESAFFNVKQII